MLIISQESLVVQIEGARLKANSAKKLKIKCCKKYKKDNRCKRCPCFDLLQKAS